MKIRVLQWGHFNLPFYDGTTIIDFLLDLQQVQNWIAKLYEAEEFVLKELYELS